MNTIKLKCKGFITADTVILSHGYKKAYNEDEKQHEKIIKSGIISSPLNSSRTYEKDGNLWIFNGWEHENNRMTKCPKYLELINVTNIIK